MPDFSPTMAPEVFDPEAADDHECEFSGDVDCDICPKCKEHTGFCVECGASECCGASERCG